ncbi:bactofilin family protein [Flavobacterium sp. TSSA_36]|jgi:cytoskeletal protein CcmA (bactofilin family)|uniref:bactofilin family protein n=1 Tax=Flavobacterium sp. TSSA_36 TaxID=3447669 RepID=UPI003F374EB0
MFDKKNKQPYTDLLGKTNRIVEATQIKGDIFSPADFRLDGELIGNFTSNGKLVIGPSGKVIGDIVCKNADIEGIFKGKLIVHELLNLKATATVEGEISIGKLAIEPGAIFTATCVMKTTETKEVNATRS